MVSGKGEIVQRQSRQTGADGLFNQNLIMCSHQKEINDLGSMLVNEVLDFIWAIESRIFYTPTAN